MAQEHIPLDPIGVPEENQVVSILHKSCEKQVRLVPCFVVAQSTT